VDGIDAAALAFKKFKKFKKISCIQEIGPCTATDEKKKSLLCVGCDFSGWYTFGKIIKIVATRCYILKLKCTKFDFSWGSVPQPAWEDYTHSAAPKLPSWI